MERYRRVDAVDNTDNWQGSHDRNGNNEKICGDCIQLDTSEPIVTNKGIKYKCKQYNNCLVPYNDHACSIIKPVKSRAEKLYSFNPFIIVLLILLLFCAGKINTESRNYSYKKEEQLIKNTLPIYMDYVQKHEENTDTADGFAIPYFSLKDLDCDNIYELFVQEDVSEKHTRWHIYTLGENGTPEPLKMEDGSDAIFDDSKDPEEGFIYFFVCNYGHLHRQCFGGTGSRKYSEDVYEMEGKTIVHSLSRKEENENDVAICMQKDSPITQEEYDSLVGDCQNNFYVFKNTAEGREFPYKEECWFIKGSYNPIKIIHSDNGDAIPDDDFVIEWKDEALEASIRKATGISAREIRYRDVCSITNLTICSDINGKKVRDISDLQYFKSLKYLHLDYQEIRDISALQGLSELEHVSLSNNDIRDITPLRGLNLKTLDLNNNSIKSIRALNGMKGLSTLRLAKNRIVDISAIHDLKMLRSLDLYGNRVKNLSPLRGLVNLSDLEAGRNRLSDLTDLENLTEMRRLGLSENRISNIEALRGLWRVDTLDLSNNRLMEVNALSELQLLSRVNLDGNPINDLESIDKRFHYE